MGNLDAARTSLIGLSLGDAFGDRFFMHAPTALALIRKRALPAPMWHYTDDTNMALSIYEILRLRGHIDQDALAQSFARHYHPSRGYGAAMHGLLGKFGLGMSWRTEAPALFNGQGSFGNGAAMRIAPLGAYYDDDIPTLITEARRSAEVTHANPEAIAGGIAVAVAAAYAQRAQGQPSPAPQAFLDLILPHIPDSEVKQGVQRARDLGAVDVRTAAETLGNGYRISAQDTVPFTLWCAAHRLAHFEEAMWLTAEGLGDIDTNCAIVGGIVAAYVGESGLPQAWIDAREPLPTWALG
jgi:ADP-ribosylglycohydrolase